MQDFGENQFRKFSGFIYGNFGISFNDEKKEMLQAKLLKLINRNNIASYDDYYKILTKGADRGRLLEFTNEITIHKTDFFRGPNHFEYIKNNMNFILEKDKEILKNGEIRAWSAGCSTGEEIYTLAMVLSECLPKGIDMKLLATDISSKVILTAQMGAYPLYINSQVDKYYLNKYFKKSVENYKVCGHIKQHVTFRVFNLMKAFPFKKPFDIIFCRNVMIYFDSQVQQNLLGKIHKTLNPGGLLFIGHSEGLANKNLDFQYMQPAVYMK